MNILFITHTRIGDAILSTGILSHLIETHPQARITVACGPAAAPLFGAAPNVERVIVMRKKPRGGHWRELWRACVGRWWNLIVDLRGSAIAYLLPGWRRKVLGGGGDLHRVVRLARLLGLAHNPPSPRLWTTEAHRAEAARLIPDGTPVLMLGPTANWIGKQWRAERFAELAARLTGPAGFLAGGRVAVIGGPDEREAAAPLIASIPAGQCIDLMGLDLVTSYACLERCAFYVGNDSGMMHLAAAAAIPTLGLFGPTRDDLYAPWGERAAFVRTKIPFLDLFGEDRGANFDHTTTGTLMDSLDVDMAERAAVDLWNRVKGAGS